MDIRFHEKLYKEGISDKKLASLQKKISHKSPKLRVFLVTLPLGEQGVLEIYWYPELLQPFYQALRQEVTVVGMAQKREDAFLLVEKIVKDAGIKEGVVLIKELFKESK